VIFFNASPSMSKSIHVAFRALMTVK
jgi:hypothetical protein